MSNKLNLIFKQKDGSRVIIDFEAGEVIPEEEIHRIATIYRKHDIKFFEHSPCVDTSRGYTLYGCKLEKKEDGDGFVSYHSTFDELVYHDEEEYPRDWKEIATGVKEEAGWRCVRCGHPHESPKKHIPCDDNCDLTRHPEIAMAAVMTQGCDIDINIYRDPDGLWPTQRQRVLTVHHLDGYKHNVVWWNLVALCQVCHLHIQGKVDMSQQYALEHSSWFRPYGAGFYAMTYLDEYLTREEVMERMDELLDLERRI